MYSLNHVLWVYWESTQKRLHWPKSVEERLHAQGTDGPSVHTCALISLSARDEKPPLTHLRKQLPLWKREAKPDKSIRLNRWSCIYKVGWWERRKVVVWGSENVCAFMCEKKEAGSRKVWEKKIKNLRKCWNVLPLEAQEIKIPGDEAWSERLDAKLHAAPLGLYNN